MLTLRQMRYFEALASTGHFGRAAELVHVSQPALSAQIAEMEKELGMPLVERRRGATILTREGEDLLPQIRQILAMTEELHGRARRRRGVLEGRIRIGIIPTVAPYLVPRLIPHLREHHPAIEIELKEAVTDRLIGELLEGKVDVMVAALPVDDDRLDTMALFADRFFMAVASNDTDVLMSPLTETEIDADRLLLLEEGHCLRDQALAVCTMAGKRSLVNFGATSMATLLQMVSHNMGMTLIPEMAIETETGRNDIRIIPFADPQPARQIGLAWRHRGASRADVEALAEAIRTCCGGKNA
jgi:LysR family transcriptional regulator, hydrogen peroxide-inducible genes activator